MEFESYSPGLARLNHILAEVRSIDDFDLRSEILIEFGESFVSVPENIAKRPFPREHLVPGCESEAYCWVIKNSDNTIKIYFAVENPQGISAKALAVILDKALSGASRDEVSMVSEDIIYDIFGRGISMGKGTGLMGMIRMVKALTTND